MIVLPISSGLSATWQSAITAKKELNTDKIVVLDNGSVAGIGKHRELLDTCPVYREIVESQRTEEDMRR